MSILKFMKKRKKKNTGPLIDSHKLKELLEVLCVVIFV